MLEESIINKLESLRLRSLEISDAIAKEGAEIAFTYQGEALQKRVAPLAESVGSDNVIPCDVSSDDAID